MLVVCLFFFPSSRSCFTEKQQCSAETLDYCGKYCPAKRVTPWRIWCIAKRGTKWQTW